MLYVDDSLPIEKLREKFSCDTYATETTGVRVIDAKKGHSVVELPLDDRHVNGVGGVMGGAIFTLADFAFAVAANTGQPPTVTVDAAIHFMSAPHGTKLIATATMLKEGRSLCYCRVEVVDEEGRPVATTTATGARVG